MTETAGMLLWRLTQTTTYREAQADEQVALLEAAFARDRAADRRALLAAEREKVAAMMLRLSIATGHGDTLDDLLVELEGQLKEVML